MREITLLSWNVNGIRAVSKKEIYQGLKFTEWLHKTKPDILCLQETKAHPEQLEPKLISPQGYKSYWNSAEKKGYSGVVTYSKLKPTKVNFSLNSNKFDSEGRVVETEYPDFVLFNVYFPNGKASDERLKYKMTFYDHFLDYINNLKEKGKSIIVCGDVNTAHKEIDLTHPKANEKISGFLPIERDWMDKFFSNGYVDTFRYFNKDPKNYTWWSMRTRARERNVGWRLDYFFVSDDLIEQVTDAYILSDIYGSDHCPVGLKLKLLS